MKRPNGEKNGIKKNYNEKSLQNSVFGEESGIIFYSRMNADSKEMVLLMADERGRVMRKG